MNTKVLRSLLASKCDKMPKAKGNIIAAVAVLEIHIDKAAVTAKMAITATPKCPRDKEIIHIAILRSSFCTCKAVAKAKPPKNKKMVGSAKVAKALVVVKGTNSLLAFSIGIPMMTANTGTNKAVMVMCTASVSHKMAMNVSKAKPLLAATS